MEDGGLVVFAEGLKEEIFELPLKRLERRSLHLVLQKGGGDGVEVGMRHKNNTYLLPAFKHNVVEGG